MADEQNRERTKDSSENEVSPESETSNVVEDNVSDDAIADPAVSSRRWLSRRNLLLLGGIPLLLLIAIALVGFFAVRFGYVGRYIERNFVAQMELIGVRTEIGEFNQTFAPLGVSMRDVKLYDKETNELLAKLDRLQLNATITDLLAPNLRRNVQLDSTEIDGLEVWVRFDAEGRSNFSRLKIPEQEESNLTFSYSSMQLRLSNALVHYGDVQRKLSGEARNIRLFVEPDAGASRSEGEVENRRFKFEMAATDSNFTVDDKPIEPIDVNTRGVITESYAEIHELNLKTPFTESRLAGTLDDWENLHYKLNVVSTVDLQQTGETFRLEQALRGFGNFNGSLEGTGAKYTLNGEIQSDALAADNVRLKGLRVDASVAGESDAYEANGKVVADMLNAGEFELDTMQLVGKVMGTGTDFRWLGDLRAAAGRIPGGGRIGELILNDAAGEYRDEQLSAAVDSLAVGSLDAFDAKVRSVRAGKARVRYENGATEATVDNLRVSSVQAEGANLRGVTALNVRINNRNGGATKVTAGKLTAENLQAEDINVRNINGSNVSAEINGGATNVTAGNLQVGGLSTAQATLGSINIAGVRLRIVRGRIEGQTNDINAGDVTLAKNANFPQGGKVENVRLARPVFVVEPSGRYRASADLSLGGGALGSIKIGRARAAVTASSGQVALENLNAQVLEGNVNGTATITYEGQGASRLAANFSDIDVSKIMALAGGQVVPIAGKTTGAVNLSFPGTNFRRASGTLNADFNAEAGQDANNRVPLTGRVGLKAANGLFTVETANLNTGKSEFNANGQFDLTGSNSDLQVALNSTDAGELQRLISVLNVSPEIDRQLANNNIQIAGNFNFSGTLTGNLTDPTINGRARFDSILANNQSLGALSTDIAVAPTGINLSNGLLAQADGGSVRFDLSVPRVGDNNVAVNATLDRLNVGNLIPALPIGDLLPAFARDVRAGVSGKINLTGIPGNLSGTAEISSSGGSIGGETFDTLNARVTIQNTLVNIEQFEARAGTGVVTARGTYEGDSTVFNLEATGQNIPLEKLRAFAGTNAASVPSVTGTLNFTARGTGEVLDFSTYNINFEGAGRNITYATRAIGALDITGKTENQQLNVNVTATLNNQPQVLTANLNFADEKLPFRAETTFNNTDLGPFAAIFQQTGSIALGGRATGNVSLAGNLRDRNERGELIFSTDTLRGEGNFTQLDLQVEDVILSAQNPLTIRFSPSQVTFNNARFQGSGSNLAVNGTVIFYGSGQSNLAADGAINLRILNSVFSDQYFGGIANLSVRFSGTSAAPRLIGSAQLDNASFTTNISDQRLTASNIRGRVLFNTNQAQIDRLEARVGGGTLVASGGAVLNNLQLQGFRFDLRGNDITVPLPYSVRATADADVQISGTRRDNVLQTFIGGNVFASRVLFTQDIDLADFIGSRQGGGSFSSGNASGNSTLGDVQLSLRVEGNNALVVRNNIADITGSLSLSVTGNAAEPLVAGRITATGGNIVLLNNQRYDITRAIIDLPSQADASPIVNVQAEAEIGSYQVFLSAIGPVSEPENLQLNLRSNPALPQADVVSLITTGNVIGTDEGIPTLAQTGLNTAAGVVTDALINQPLSRATDRLFGLNRFAIDPVLAGRQGINPGARLTVGRQINRNLLVTYSTNLASDRNQIIALEYRVSNRLSFIAQYEQAPLTNVTRRNDNFSFLVRFRRRF